LRRYRCELLKSGSTAEILSTVNHVEDAVRKFVTKRARRSSNSVTWESRQSILGGVMGAVHPYAAALSAAALSAAALVSDALAAPIVDPFTSASTQVCYVGITPCVSAAFQPGDGPFSFNGGPSSSSMSRADNAPGEHVAANASMVIDPGIFSAYVSSSGMVTAVALSTYGYSTSAFGTVLDSLTISSGAFLDLPIHLTGVVNIGYSESGSYIYPAGSLSFATVTLSLSCHASDVGGSAPGRDCSHSFLFTSSADVDSIVHFLIPFTAETPFYVEMRPTLSAQFGLPGITIDALNDGKTAVIEGHAIGDFSHTGVFEAATVLDASGNPLPDAIIESASGFDYRAGFGATPVPEPATFILFGFGLAGLGLIRRRCAAGEPTSSRGQMPVA
jgi:PEP-CTERM motif